MKNKFLAVLFASVLAVTTLAGCGSSSAPASGTSDSKSSETKTETTTETTTDSASASTGKQTDGKNLPTLTTEPLEILLWDIATDDPGKSTQEAAVQRFMADYPNIKVTQVHQQNDNYKQQLVVAMSSGQCPDMYMHWGGGPMA